MPDPRRIRATAHAVSLLDLPVTLTDLAAVGVTRGRVRSAVDAGELRPVRRGFWVPTAMWTDASANERHEWALRAALRAFPGTWASRQSAARLLGLPTFDPADIADDVPHVHLSRAGTTWGEQGVTIHGNEVPDSFVGLVDDLPSTDLVRTSIEMAATPSRRRALAVVDAGMRLYIGVHHPTHLREAVRAPGNRDAARRYFDAAVAPFARHRWVTTVRHAVLHGDPAAESVLESFSRSEILAEGLPTPQCGVPIHGDDGVLYWVDLWWDDFGVIGEADGLAKYSSLADLVGEKRRQEALRSTGRQVVRWGWDEGVTNPSIMIGRLRRALRPQLPRARLRS